MKKQYRIFKIKTRMFNHTIHVFVGSKEDLLTYLRKKYTVDLRGIDGKDGGFFAEEENVPNILWLSLTNGGITSIGIMVHELMHLVFHMMRNVGIELNEGSEEVFAYTMNDVLEQVMEGIYDEKKVTSS